MCTDDEAAMALASRTRKSDKPDDHPGMEGARKGLPHLTPVSLRYRNAHAAAGNKVDLPYDEG